MGNQPDFPAESASSWPFELTISFLLSLSPSLSFAHSPLLSLYLLSSGRCRLLDATDRYLISKLALGFKAWKLLTLWL